MGIKHLLENTGLNCSWLSQTKWINAHMKSETDCPNRPGKFIVTAPKKLSKTKHRNNTATGTKKKISPKTTEKTPYKEFQSYKLGLHEKNKINVFLFICFILASLTEKLFFFPKKQVLQAILIQCLFKK